ncbi:MAG: hypothetical protein ACK55I_08995, partial [bacterium]
MPTSTGGELHFRPAAEQVEQVLLIGTIHILMDGVMGIIEPDVPGVAARGKLPDRAAQEGRFTAEAQIRRANGSGAGLGEGQGWIVGLEIENAALAKGGRKG